MHLLYGRKDLGGAADWRGSWVDAMKYAHIASRILSRPILLEPRYASVFFSAFGSRMGIDRLVNAEGVEGSVVSHIESYQVRKQRFAKGVYEPYAIMGNGVAVISMEGSLVQKTGNLDPESGMQGYDGVAAKLDAAINDQKVSSILLNIDSPGGEVSGAFDLADKIASMRGGKKPIVAYANDMMASAAYLIGSQADALYASQTANLGSIGVLVAHADNSKRLEDSGVKITLIHSGKHKVDGNPYSPLPDDVRADLQSEVDSIRDKFAAYVAKGRKKDKSDILGTEAKVFSAEDAVKIGLADGVMSFDNIVSHLSSTAVSRSGNQRDPKGTRMSENAQATPGLSDAEVEKLMSDARDEGVRSGIVAERSRILAIISHAESVGRDATAKHLAFATDMEVDAAVALLATLPKAEQKQNPLIAGLAEGAGVKAEPESERISDAQAAVDATKAALAKLLKR